MPDLISIEIMSRLFSSVAEEMGIVLMRSAFSANIKERRDFSCAVFDAAGELVAQASHIPVHLGSMPMTLAHILAACPPGPGDTIICNDPYHGGSHLPDITLAQGVFDTRGAIRFYVVNRAHHADIGGRTPGSMGLAHSIDDEGVRIVPTCLVKAGVQNEDFLSNFLSQVRNPEERLGDLRAQQASLRRGMKRLEEIGERYGHEACREVIPELKDYAERLMRNAIRSIPDGCYQATDFLDNDGIGNRPVPITVGLMVTDDHATLDFTASADQVGTAMNAVESVTLSSTLYVFQCLVGEGYPINQGSLRPLTVITRPGSVVHALAPAAVAAGNVETSQRIVDVLLAALAQGLPAKIPAASCGSMNNIAIGSLPGALRPFTYYETLGGGMGARPGHDGLSGIHTHMTNTMNTPIEALEHAYPFQVMRYGLRRNSGGKGLHRGGDGVVRSYRFDTEASVSLLTERRSLPPYGMGGGTAGQNGENSILRQNKTTPLPGKEDFLVQKGDILTIRTPGGGGWGKTTPGE